MRPDLTLAWELTPGGDYCFHLRHEYELQPLGQSHRVHRERLPELVLLFPQRLVPPKPYPLHLVLYLRDFLPHLLSVRSLFHAAVIRDLRTGCKSRKVARTSKWRVSPLPRRRPTLCRRAEQNPRYTLPRARFNSFFQTRAARFKPSPHGFTPARREFSTHRQSLTAHRE